jgi:predicted small lipoprotein YifL
MIRALTPIAVALALAVAGCGQKGPLRIPEPAPAKSEPGKSEPGKPAATP